MNTSWTAIGIEAVKMNTARLRIAARDAASVGCWQEAADLMEQAIREYPARSGALAEHDLNRMKELANSWQIQARQTDDPSRL